MAKKEKVNMDAIRTYVEKVYSPTVNVEHNGLTITVKKHLGLDEMVAFVDGAVNSCFVGQDNKFMPEIRDFAIRSGVFTMYVGLELPEDMGERYDLLYSLSDVYFAILDVIDQTQLIEMSKAIDRKIDARVDVMVSDVERHSQEILGTLNTMVTSYNKMYDGVDADDVNEFIKAVASGSFNLDEEKIAAAILDQREEKG